MTALSSVSPSVPKNISVQGNVATISVHGKLWDIQLISLEGRAEQPLEMCEEIAKNVQSFFLALQNKGAFNKDPSTIEVYGFDIDEVYGFDIDRPKDGSPYLHIDFRHLMLEKADESQTYKDELYDFTKSMQEFSKPCQSTPSPLPGRVAAAKTVSIDPKDLSSKEKTCPLKMVASLVEDRTIPKNHENKFELNNRSENKHGNYLLRMSLHQLMNTNSDSNHEGISKALKTYLTQKFKDKTSSFHIFQSYLQQTPPSEEDKDIMRQMLMAMKSLSTEEADHLIEKEKHRILDEITSFINNKSPLIDLGNFTFLKDLYKKEQRFIPAVARGVSSTFNEPFFMLLARSEEFQEFMGGKADTPVGFVVLSALTQPQKKTAEPISCNAKVFGPEGAKVTSNFIYLYRDKEGYKTLNKDTQTVENLISTLNS
ncbi:MAG: hypothetical protein EBZ47_04060 [Chlamydiae bacterium]|nr:hypothetical protein [Chlamydiota bacterium]